MNLWFDPAAWRKRAGARIDHGPCDTATVATANVHDAPSSSDIEISAETVAPQRVEDLGVATVAVSQDAASVETAILLRDDVLERAAILEFCEGLARKDADVQALAEFGCTCWEASVLLRAEVAD
jgi:hypothetical protein